jgi:DoxX-like family
VNKTLWAGRGISALVVLFLLFDSVIHLTKPDQVVQAFAELGFPLSLSIPIATVEFFCLLLYMIPRTSILGAVLLTGYLGGAVATQLRVGNPLFAQTLFPVYFGVMVWSGLFLRDSRLLSLISNNSGSAR